MISTAGAGVMRDVIVFVEVGKVCVLVPVTFLAVTTGLTVEVEVVVPAAIVSVLAMMGERGSCVRVFKHLLELPTIVSVTVVLVEVKTTVGDW